MHFTNNVPWERKSGAATLPYQVTKCLKFISYNADSSKVCNVLVFAVFG